MSNTDTQNNLSQEIFELFFSRMKEEGISEDIIERLKNILSEKGAVTGQCIKAAMCPGDVG